VDERRLSYRLEGNSALEVVTPDYGLAVAARKEGFVLVEAPSTD